MSGAFIGNWGLGPVWTCDVDEGATYKQRRRRGGPCKCESPDMSIKPSGRLRHNWCRTCHRSFDIEKYITLGVLRRVEHKGKMKIVRLADTGDSELPVVKAHDGELKPGHYWIKRPKLGGHWEVAHWCGVWWRTVGYGATFHPNNDWVIGPRVAEPEVE